MIIADEEYLNTKGQKRVRNYVASVRSLEAIEKGDFTIPALKEIDESKIAENKKKEEDFIDPFSDENVTNNDTESNSDSPFVDDEDDFDPFS